MQGESPRILPMALIASGNERPVTTNSSSTLSKLAESLPPGRRDIAACAALPIPNTVH